MFPLPLPRPLPLPLPGDPSSLGSIGFHNFHWGSDPTPPTPPKHIQIMVAYFMYLAKKGKQTVTNQGEPKTHKTQFGWLCVGKWTFVANMNISSMITARETVTLGLSNRMSRWDFSSLQGLLSCCVIAPL